MHEPETNLLTLAFTRAAQWHEGQLRDGDFPLPYLSHPIDVVNRLRYEGGVTNQDILAAAALHDVIEECGVTGGQIRDEFGPRVAGLVLAVTRSEPTMDAIAGLSAKEVWLLRARMLLDEVSRMDAEAQLLKLGDRRSNLSAAIVTKKGDKLDRYVAQSVAILQIIPKRVNSPLWRGIHQDIERVGSGPRVRAFLELLRP